MRYVPDLIPKENRVLPEYFKGSKFKKIDDWNPFTKYSLIAAAISIFLVALAFLNHFFLFLLLAALGFVLLPFGHFFLEKHLHFKLTTKIKSAFCSLLLLCSIPTFYHYAEIDRQEAFNKKVQEEKLLKEQQEAQTKENERYAKLSLYLKESTELEKSHKLKDALIKLDTASMYALKDHEKRTINESRTSIFSLQISDLIKSNNYKDALSKLQNIIPENATNSDLLYKRALCYYKTGKTEDAILELKELVKSGHEEASRLYDKVNPIKKRIVGYVTRCCDGSTSHATGRGACSHHGGVCNWSDPIYEEYRKY